MKLVFNMLFPGIQLAYCLARIRIKNLIKFKALLKNQQIQTI